MDAPDSMGPPNPSQKVVALPSRRVVATSDADAAPPAPPRELTVDDVPLLAFARDRDEGVEVPDGVPLGLRVGIAARPVVWFESPPLPIETTADELRGKWGAAPFVVYLYELSERSRLSRAVKQWQVTLDPESERDIGHEPWVFSQAVPVPPAVAKLHRDREALRQRHGSTTPDPYEAWGLGADADAPTTAYDRAPPSHDRYGREMAHDARGEGDLRYAHDDGDGRSYDERAPRSRRELAERETDAPPTQVFLPPGKQWVRDAAGLWLQIDAQGAPPAPRRSGIDALLDRFADDPAAVMEKIAAAALALKTVVDTLAPRQIAAPPSRNVDEVLAEARARWEADRKAAELATQLHAMQGQLGAMRAEVCAAREVPPPPPPKSLAEQVAALKETYEALPFVRGAADADGSRPQSTLAGVTELIGTVLNSDVGNKIAEVAAPAIEEATQVKRLQRQMLERQLAQQQQQAQQFAPPPQQAQQFAAPSIAHPPTHSPPEADGDAGEELSP